MNLITAQMLNEMEYLYEKGATYLQIAERMKEKYNISLHTDTVRYHVKRKHQEVKPKSEKLQEQGIEKVLTFGDCHIPYSIDGLLDIVKKHKDEITTIVIGGDLLDCEEISVFKGLGKGDLGSEMVQTHKFLKDLQDMTPNVKKILIKGNHCVRFERYLADTNTALNALHTDNVLQEIVDGFKITDFKAGKTTYYKKLEGYEVVDNWWVKYNDAIFCHPMKFSKIQGRVVNDAIDYFVRIGEHFSACFVFHTHKISMVPNFDKWGFEVGCTCLPMPYASKSGKLGLTNQNCGYHLAVFKDGKYDINESKQYVI